MRLKSSFIFSSLKINEQSIIFFLLLDGRNEGERADAGSVQSEAAEAVEEELSLHREPAVGASREELPSRSGHV